MTTAALGCMLAPITEVHMSALWWLVIPLGLLVLVIVRDRTQRQHAIISNFPVVGRFRYWVETLGSPLRQYIVTNNDEERPFSRDQRRWVYASSKHENNYFGYGTDNDLELASNYIIVRHSAFPLPVSHVDPEHRCPCAKVMGASRKRRHAFRPRSIVNVSAMSFGSLSGRAVEAINRGVALAGALQNTGEGGVSEHHLHGGELIWQLGTGYFGCRDNAGKFSLERLLETISSAPVRALEIKLSQGAKPGLGGVLPAAKLSPEIAKIRLVPVGRDCISPTSHSAFHDVSSLLDFIERLADATGLPVGIKSAVGEIEFWQDLALQMDQSGRAPDFITIDGGEGGTGAAPLVFSDHVALPFKLGFSEVYRTFAERGLNEKIVFIGSGRLGFPAQALLGLALGCDMINVAREALLAIGCIQAQQCHTDHCPTGIATQNRWLMGGLDPQHKSARLANYLVTIRKELLQLAHACGVPHPSLVPLHRLDLVEGFNTSSARDLFRY
ncbi:MAG TPA: FMN-binding glutamate synthase family protein, partial [Polyangiales bacterium]|nr:FMN-binding glutamate synthase family protein [Polyangiales bacterium]